MWVRLPPRAPFYLLENTLVNAATSTVYPACTLRLGREERIAAPCLGQIGFQLFLPCTYPRCVVFLRKNEAAIRTLVCPRRIDTRSIGTPLRRSSTAKVSLKRCACPSSTFAKSNSRCSRVCQLLTMLSNFPVPLQKKCSSPATGVTSIVLST